MAESENRFAVGAGVRVGLDVGSTTTKLVIFRDGEIVYQKYERHHAAVRQKTLSMLRESEVQTILASSPFRVALSGSAGMGIAESAGIPFVQEVFATGELVKRTEPDTAAVIELGGEDAKIIFFKGGVDERMNGSCAGGTGAFIDQMATLLNLTPDELDELSLRHERIYPIASRCGVFAKSDIQPLINQGARKEDIAASIYQSVVNQTISGLAGGRRLEGLGKILFLGGPLYYDKGLRERFVQTLHLSPQDAVFPDYSLFAVAIGAALYADKSGEETTFDELIKRLEKAAAGAPATVRLPPLFSSREEYDAFRARHAAATVPQEDIALYRGRAWLGIDCGSTTTKLALIGEERQILHTYYSSNRGGPVELLREQLLRLRDLCGERIRICGSAVTGYGEELIRHAFGVDLGIVETIAHFTAAEHFCPQVDFILDIGGQDIKCFRVRGGAIDSIMLNEACSSGCGSFIETFAHSLGYEPEDFARAALFAPAPVDLGSRCTVFMNSSVKQAQKDGATVEEISAGIAVSVVKNAVYKVIRAADPADLGEHIVVQGGTFLSDAVLRAFEREMGRQVIRPAIAGLMGAYGAALYARDTLTESSLISREALERFTHSARSAVCGGCANHCNLTVNLFPGGVRFISGNKCEKGEGKAQSEQNTLPNLYETKRALLATLSPVAGRRGATIGLPLCLSNYELAPLWYGVFTNLGFGVRFSQPSTRATYERGQYTIPSDTACYPAKIMHGHIEELIADGVDLIFYPCLTYNIDEGRGDNHYNCPVVAYYAELLHANLDDLRDGKTRLLYPYLNINNQKELARELTLALRDLPDPPREREVREAVAAGFALYEEHRAAVREAGEAALADARARGGRVMVLAGRPYHIDQEICHGIDRLATRLGFTVVSEDSVSHLSPMPRVRVLNQWTYHARLYAAANYVATHDDCCLVQLVSFGCGVDAITTDEVRSILEGAGKLYTQIKIDEVTNLGAVNIRLRSLLGTLERREGKLAPRRTSA